MKERRPDCLCNDRCDCSTDVLPAILAHAIDLLEQLLSVIRDCQQSLHEILKWILAVAAELWATSFELQVQMF